MKMQTLLTERFPASPVPVVAIGASAGGLEAVSELIGSLPPTTGMAFVYIQHLEETTPATSSSENNPLVTLGRVTAMPVVEVEHQMPILPNQVYVIMSHRNTPVTEQGGTAYDLRMSGGVLTFVSRRQATNLPIDRFFMSLADHQRDGAVAVLLSGTSADGTLGMRAVRAGGGLTFAQDETARFQTMPRSAIVEDLVDRVLPPVRIARELEELSQKSSVLQQAAGANALENSNPADDGPADDDELADDRTGATKFGTLTDYTGYDSATTADGAGSSDAMGQATEADVRRIIRVIQQTIGPDFSQYKMTTIRRRIIRRMLLLRLESLPDYAQYLHQHPDEVRALYNDLLINVTTFFRDGETMDYLRQVLLPRIIQNKAPQEPLRIWIPACSTGQEAYSIAMLLLEILGDRAAGMTIQLFATDLSEPTVTKARLGTYTRGEVMDVSPRRLQRFFSRVDDHYRINKVVRDLCVFAPHNLLKDPPFSRLDLVSCRNLLIYLDAPLQRKAIATFHYALNTSGFLLLGKAESTGPSALFAPIELTHKVYVRRNDLSATAAGGRALFALNMPIGFPSGNNNAGHPSAYNLDETAQQPPGADAARSANPGSTRPPARIARTKPATNELDRAVDGLLSRYVPTSVVVDPDLEIRQFRGSTGLFLEPASGRASLNLLKMARPALAFELRNIIHKAGQSGQPERRSGIELNVKGTLHYVAVEAVPFHTDADVNLFLILFEELPAILTPAIDPGDARSQRIKQLETELATLREDMRSVIEDQEATHEELQSASEEVISSNEELQSINEELETSKEEIESTNEELLTINQELQVRNDQLSESYAFAEAIFGTISEATLVLTPDLRIKSANPVFYTLFNLNESETEGRLIYELANRQWDIPQLRALLTDVATRDVQVQDFELTYRFPGVGEKVLSLNARRVVRQQEAILLAIEDITGHRQIQKLLQEREARFLNIADNAPVLTWVAGADGHYTFFNNVWLEYTGNLLDDMTANGWITAIHPDDRAGYKQTYHSCFETRNPFQAEYRLRRHDGNYHWVLENAQPTFTPGGQFTGYIGTATDVHGQKELNFELDRRVAERTAELIQANIQLEESGTTIRQMLDGSMAAICLLESVRDETKTIIDFLFKGGNRAAEVLNRMTAAELSSERYRVRFPGVEKALFDDFIRVVETGEILRTEIYYQGEHFDNWFDVSAVKNGDGFILTYMDITDRKQAEKQTMELTEALQAVLDTSPASIALLKALFDSDTGAIVDFRMEVANQQFSSLIGEPLNRLNQLRASQFADRLWGRQALDRLAGVVETGQAFYVEQQTPDGGWVALSVSKQDHGVVITALDITSLRQMQQQREEMLDQVSQSGDTLQALSMIRRQVQERGELLRTSSHDLRGSLGVIQGAADLLSFADSDEERAQMLDMIQRNVQQTTRLIGELLDLSRLEAGQQQTQLAPFDAAELLGKLGENVRPLVEGKGLVLHLPDVVTLPVEGDALSVLRIAQNVVLNALKYTTAGSITLDWGIDGPDEWFFSVADTGPGMNQATANQLSHGSGTVVVEGDGQEPTNRPANSMLPVSNEPILGPSSGEGIGLVIVRQLCDLLRGRLIVSSQLDTGSLFRVWFPRQY